MPSGDNNSPCLKKTAYKPDGAACSLNATCSSGVCSGGICIATQKRCPALCSMRGVCISRTIEDIDTDYCAYNDPFCYSTCICDHGYFGRDCSKNYEEYSRDQLFRSKLCGTLRSSMSFQDNTENLVRARILSIADILNDIALVDDSTLLSCFLVLQDSITANPELTCSNNLIASTVSAALSNILSAFTSSSPSNDYLSSVNVLNRTLSKAILLTNISSTIDIFTKGCQSNLAIGEEAQSMVSPNLRMTTIMADSDSLRNFSLYAPQSTFELLESISTGSVSVDGNYLATSEILGLGLVEYSCNPTKIFTNSSSIAISTSIYQQGLVTATLNSLGIDLKSVVTEQQLKRLNGQHEKRSRSNFNMNSRTLMSIEEQYNVFVPDFEITLQNKDPINYSFLSSSINILKCNQTRSSPYEVSHDCPDGSSYNLTCPANIKGVLVIRCPGFSTVPFCTVYDSKSDAFEVDDECVVVSFTSTNTTCKCSESNDRRRRWLQNVDTQQYFYHQYSTGLKTMRDSLEVEFIEGVPVVRAVPSNVVTLSLMVIGGLMCIGCGIYLYQLKLERKHDKYNPKDVTQCEQQVKRSRTIESFFLSIYPLYVLNTPWRRHFLNYLYQEMTVFGLFISHVTTSNQHHTLSVHVHHIINVVLVGSKMLTFIFSVTLVLWYFSADDGYCQSILESTTCESETTFFGHKQSCRWEEINESCQYQSFSFQDIRLFIAISQIILIGTSPYNRFLSWLVDDFSILLHQQRKTSVVAGTEDILDKNISVQTQASSLYREHIIDEFKTTITKRGLLFRAARLFKLQRVADFQNTEDESDYLRILIERKIKRREKNNNATSRLLSYQYDLPQELTKYEIGLDGMQSKQIKRLLTNTIPAVTAMRYSIRTLLNSASQDQYLMISFLQDLVPWLYRPVLLMLLQESSLTKSFMPISGLPMLLVWEVCKPYVSLIVFVSHLGLSGYYSYQFGINIGSLNMPLWSVMVLVIAFQSLFCIEIIRIVVLRIWLVHEVVLVHYHCQWSNMMKRAKLILLRSTGLMKRSHMFVQHFNATCRVARSFPELPISRFMLSIYDRDLILIDPLQRSLWRSCLGLLLFPIFILSFVLPLKWLDSFLESFHAIAMSVLIFGFYELSFSSKAASIIASVGILVVVVLRELFIFWSKTHYVKYYGSFGDSKSECIKMIESDFELDNIVDVDTAIKLKKERMKHIPLYRPGVMAVDDSVDIDIMLQVDQPLNSLGGFGIVQGNPISGALDGPLDEMNQRFEEVASSHNLVTNRNTSSATGLLRTFSNIALGRNNKVIIPVNQSETITTHMRSRSSSPEPMVSPQWLPQRGNTEPDAEHSNQPGLIINAQSLPYTVLEPNDMQSLTAGEELVNCDQIASSSNVSRVPVPILPPLGPYRSDRQRCRAIRNYRMNQIVAASMGFSHLDEVSEDNMRHLYVSPSIAHSHYHSRHLQHYHTHSGRGDATVNIGPGSNSTGAREELMNPPRQFGIRAIDFTRIGIVTPSTYYDPRREYPRYGYLTTFDDEFAPPLDFSRYDEQLNDVRAGQLRYFGQDGAYLGPVPTTPMTRQPLHSIERHTRPRNLHYHHHFYHLRRSLPHLGSEERILNNHQTVVSHDSHLSTPIQGSRSRDVVGITETNPENQVIDPFSLLSANNDISSSMAYPSSNHTSTGYSQSITTPYQSPLRHRTTNAQQTPSGRTSTPNVGGTERNGNLQSRPVSAHLPPQGTSNSTAAYHESTNFFRPQSAPDYRGPPRPVVRGHVRSDSRGVSRGYRALHGSTTGQNTRTHVRSQSALPNRR